MAVEVLGDRDEAAMYCNTSGRAFGPVHRGDVNAVDELREFVSWCHENRGDPRKVDDVHEAYSAWRDQWE